MNNNDLHIESLTDRQLFATLGLLGAALSRPLPIPVRDRTEAKLAEAHAEIERRGLKATFLEFGPEEASLSAIAKAVRRRAKKPAKAPVKPAAPKPAAKPAAPAARGSHADCTHEATKAARAACRRARQK